MYNYNQAQKYELDWQEAYIKSALKPEFDRWMKSKIDNPLASWFPDPKEFLKHTKGKTGLDVGCGSIPMLRYPCGLGDRFVLDPLADDYKRIQTSVWGGSFFDGLFVISKPAEEFLTIKVDGVIIFRNALDHADDPLRILYNLSQYALPGCYLLFWTDLWHNDEPDPGHKNITRCTEMMDIILVALGWEFQHTIPAQRDTNVSLEYGGVWRKL